jgi:DNA repair protein RecO (recombination protein O)
MLTKTEGIVLKTQKYGEADLIVTFLTPDRGIITTFAKSPRKTKSRFGSSLEPLTYSRISLWGKEQAMPKVTQSDIIDSFHELRENYNDFINISKLAEILISLTPADIPSRKAFPFFRDSLRFLMSHCDDPKDLMYLITQIRLLVLVGYAPRLKSCGRCDTEGNIFFPHAGSVLCLSCAPELADEPPMKISGRTATFYTHCIEWPADKLSRLKPQDDVLVELSEIIDQHINYLLSKKLMTSKYLESSSLAG